MAFRWRNHCVLLLALLWAQSSAALGQSLFESWDAAYISGVKVGYIHTIADHRDVGGQVVVHMRQSGKLTIKRFNDSLTISTQTDSFEHLDGRLYAVETRTKMAKQEQTSRGVLGSDGIFRHTVNVGGKKVTHDIDWSDDIFGAFWHEKLLKDKPLSPGETRSFKTFLPELNAVTVSTLRAVRKEKTKLHGDTMKELLLVKQTSDKLPITISMWLDDEGDVIKTSLSLGGLPMTTFRVSRAVALGEPVGDGVDLGYQTLVKLDRPIRDAHSVKAVTYRLEFANAKTAKSFPSAPYQKILSRDGNVVRVRVIKLLPPPDARRKDVARSQFEDELGSNGFIQSDHPKIAQTAKSVAGNTNDAWQKTIALERWVDRNMTNRDFSVGLATAGEVIETRQGDCTEHAVLLAALCRAVDVPSRVAMGLVYVEGAGAFAYHMWTEVNVGGTWYAVDGTLGQGYVGGGHLKLTHGSLAGASALSTFLPIINVIGKLKIQVEKIER